MLFKADLSGAYLDHVNLEGAMIALVDLGGANLTGARLSDESPSWRGIRNLENANLYGVRNPPEGFMSWAVHEKRAVCVEDVLDWRATVNGERPIERHPTDEAELTEFCGVTYTDDESTPEDIS